MEHSEQLKPLEQLAKEAGRYPPEAFDFVREGLQFTIRRVHGSKECCHQHITGQDLCWGLRDFALKRWGLLAPTVLKSWNIITTEDFGAIVFTMVEAGWMAKNDHDSADDFNGVYDFKSAFETDLKIK